LLTGAVARVKKRGNHLKDRYGPRYARAMLATLFVALLVPLPGGVLVGVALVALIVGIAEVHRANSQRGRFPEAVAELVVAVKANLPLWALGRRPPPC
jgi:hypothetical protein